MSVQRFLDELGHDGVRLRIEGANLAYDGPEELVTPEVINTLRALKAQIIAVLGAREAHRRTTAASTTPPRVRGCWWCRGRRFWESIHGLMICSSCHPPAAGQLVAAELDLPEPEGVGTGA